MSEFDEWAKRFEFRTVSGEWKNGAFEHRQEPLDPPHCMYPVKEGPHKVAHHVDARYRSVDGYPACGRHKSKAVRPAWRGYVEGA